MAINKIKIYRWLKIIILLYCGAGIAMYYLQERILFHPEKLPANFVFNFKQPYEEVFIPVNKTDTINMVKFLPAGKLRCGVVLYFHGNMKNIPHYADYTLPFTSKGYEVWMPDYPGFGKSTGELTEKSLYALAEQVQRLAATKYCSDSIIIYGKSLGTGFAAYLASITENKMLILETPYYSIPDIFYCHTFIYPVNKMIRFKVPVYEYLPDVKSPVVIFHGTADRVIPYRCAAKLQQYLKPGDKFITIDGADHQDINRQTAYYRAIDSLLN